MEIVLSEFGLPVGVVAVAVGLVRGARALEKDASEPALKYVSGLLIGGGLINIGKLGATLIPVIFDRIFGPRPLSLKFISRSVLATTLLWFILLAAKHPNWSRALQNSIPYGSALILIPAWYILDWISLVKARYLVNIISDQFALKSTFLFFLADVVCSFALVILVIATNMAFLLIYNIFQNQLTVPIAMLLANPVPVVGYLYANSDSVTLFDVVVPSTLLTSIWTFLLLLSSMIAVLFIPIDHLRRFTAWWFRDLDKHPLTAIAKVAATLIILGAAVIKAVRWVGA